MFNFRYVRLRSAAIVIQKNWRRRGPWSRYKLINKGYKRLQSLIISRLMKAKFEFSRKRIIKFQVIHEKF